MNDIGVVHQYQGFSFHDQFVFYIFMPAFCFVNLFERDCFDCKHFVCVVDGGCLVHIGVISFPQHFCNFKVLRSWFRSFQNTQPLHVTTMRQQHGVEVSPAVVNLVRFSAILGRQLQVFQLFVCLGTTVMHFGVVFVVHLEHSSSHVNANLVRPCF